MCGAGCGPCAAARLRVCGHGEGGVARRKKRVPHACRCGPPEPPRPPATSVGQPTVCAPHSPAHFAGCAACGAGAGSGGCGERREPARDATWAAVDHRILVCVRSPGWRGERALEPKRCASSKRNRKFADGGLPADKKIEQLVFQSQARRKAGRGAGGRASRLGTPGPSRSASAARLARLVKKRKRRPPEGAPTAEEAHRMHARNPALPTLFKTTRRAQSTRRRACCKVFRLRRRGGRWVGEMGRGAGEGVATSTAAFPRRGRARAARSGLCRPPPGYFSTSPG